MGGLVFGVTYTQYHARVSLSDAQLRENWKVNAVFYADAHLRPGERSYSLLQMVSGAAKLW